jgi:mono/diheme cytochrome c family protein
MHVSKISFFSLLLVGAAILSGCKSLPPSKPESEFTPQEARGQVVYKVKCARCHNATNTRPLNGPGLQALTKVKAMPSGAPPNDERMTDRILHGYAMMPSTQLTDDQLQDLLVYLHTI